MFTTTRVSELEDKINKMEEKLDFICKELGYEKREHPMGFMFIIPKRLTKWDKLLEFLKLEWVEEEIKSFKKKNNT